MVRRACINKALSKMRQEINKTYNINVICGFKQHNISNTSYAKYQELCIVLLKGNVLRQKYICFRTQLNPLLDINKNVLYIVEIYDKIVENWKQENVIDTRIIKQMSKLVETEPVVLAIGPSGCGKSTAIHHVAVELQRRNKFSIVPAKSAEDILNHYNPDIQQVFVIDDLCGKATIDTNKVKQWYDHSNDINEIINENKVRILASCRIHIFQDRLLQPIKLLRKAKSCDFLSEEISLTYKERRQIASLYLRKEETDQLFQFSNISSFEFFPLLCYLYSKKRTGNIIQFFENPTKVIRYELKQLLEADNQKTFGTLMLFIVYNNYLSRELLERTSGIKPILETINDTLHLNSNFSIKVVKSELENLKTFYVKNDTNAYSLIHDIIFDILVCFQGEHDFDILIDIAHTDVIRDRFLLMSLSENDSNDCHDKVLMIPVEKEETYLCRLFKDIKEGFLEKVFLNKNLACDTFRKRLIEKIKTLSNLDELLHKVSSEKIYFLILFMLHKRYRDAVPLLITEHVDLNKVYNIGETPLFVAVNEKYSDIVNLFLNNNVNPNIPSWYTYRPMQETPRGAHNSITNVGNTFKKRFLSDNHRLSRTSTAGKLDFSFDRCSSKSNIKYKKTPLYIASLKGFTNIVEMLLKHNADPNIENDYKNVTPLYIATAKGHTKIVTLLLKFKASPNFCDKFNITPLYIATEAGHYDIVKLLLEYNSDPNTNSTWYDSKRDRKIPIHIASEKGYVEIVILLLSNQADPNIRDKFYKTALYLASARHHTGVVKTLLQYGAYPDIIYSVDNNSPISIASENGYVDIVTILLENKADPNIRDKFNRTALYLASIGHHTEVVKILHQHGAFRHIICSEDNNSPISIASEKGYGDIVKLLEKASFSH